MFLNFAQLLSFELSKEITVIFAITYMLFCNLYFFWIFTWKLNFSFHVCHHHFHTFQYFLIMTDISLTNISCRLGLIIKFLLQYILNSFCYSPWMSGSGF